MPFVHPNFSQNLHLCDFLALGALRIRGIPPVAGLDTLWGGGYTTPLCGALDCAPTTALGGMDARWRYSEAIQMDDWSNACWTYSSMSFGPFRRACVDICDQQFSAIITKMAKGMGSQIWSCNLSNRANSFLAVLTVICLTITCINNQEFMAS